MENPSLGRYRQKRNFSFTSEPAGKPRRRKKSETLIFVVQKHAASHLHYDFRLELDGTLKSWAVPKGPSLDPKDKRLALAVEDHPMEYADFEGTIAPGNYGAGTVIVWDRGEWIPQGDPAADYARGEIKFELRGEKLSGHWVLVKTHGRYNKKENAWLLIKERDDQARPLAEFNVVEAMPDSVLGSKGGRVGRSKRAAKSVRPQARAQRPKQADKVPLPREAIEAPLPPMLAPQLAMLVDAVPTSGDWSYELKFDGYRILACIDNGEIKLFTRNGNDWTAKLKHIAAALKQLAIDNAWIDGEVVMMGKNDQPDFQALQNAFENSRTSQIQFFMFDLPYFNGFDLRRARLDARRELLEKVLKKVAAPLHFSNAFDMSGRQLLKKACDMELEGLIGKLKNSSYQSARTRDWIKLKCLQRQEFVIGGYTDSKRPASGAFGSLLLGVYEKDGKLRYAGKVGTGFTETSLRQLMAKMKPLVRDTMPFDEFSDERPTRATHWVEPKLVGEVAFAEWTTSGHIRHSSFQGLRADKLARGITVELPVSPPTETKRKDAKSKSAEINVTHGDRVIDPKTGFTKQQMVDFYQMVAPQLLIHLNNRPVSLLRAPAGIDGQLFFQKHLDRVKVAEVREVDTEFFPGHPPLIIIDTEIALLSCAQMNVIEFHTWNASLGDNKHPDRIIFDLDPGEGVVWKQIQDAAQLMKVMLDQLQIKSFLKTSGGKGLHVVIPVQPQYDWDTVKDFSAKIVGHLASTLPTLFVAKSGPRNRVGRIFIDYLRNGLGATTVSAWSVRARPGLGVSMPVAWDELSELTGGSHWTVANAVARLDGAYKKVWADYSKSAQTLEKAMSILGF